MSTTALPVVDSTTTVKKSRFAFTRSRVFWSSFVVAIIVNTILLLAIFAAYNHGVEVGFEGESSFSWDKVASGIGALSGGLGSLIVALVILAVVAAILLFVHRLSERGHHTMVVVIVVLAVIVGKLFLDPLLQSMAALTFGFTPFLAIVILTILEALAVLAVLTTLSRKRDTH
jgi:hypothetical protein